MSTRIPETDLQALWQNLETETTTMSAQQMSMKTQELLRKTRHDLIARSAFAVIAAAFCGIVFISTRMSIGLIAGVNYGMDPGVLKFLPGVRFSWNVPGFAFLNTDVTGYLDASEGVDGGEFNAVNPKGRGTKAWPEGRAQTKA